MAKLADRTVCHSGLRVRSPQNIMRIIICVDRSLFLHIGIMIVCKNKDSEDVAKFLSNRLSGQLQPTTFLLSEGILSMRLYRKSSLDGQAKVLQVSFDNKICRCCSNRFINKHVESFLMTTSMQRFKTTSSIELVVCSIKFACTVVK